MNGTLHWSAILDLYSTHRSSHWKHYVSKAEFWIGWRESGSLKIQTFELLTYPVWLPNHASPLKTLETRTDISNPRITSVHKLNAPDAHIVFSVNAAWNSIKKKNHWHRTQFMTENIFSVLKFWNVEARINAGPLWLPNRSRQERPVISLSGIRESMHLDDLFWDGLNRPLRRVSSAFLLTYMEHCSHLLSTAAHPCRLGPTAFTWILFQGHPVHIHTVSRSHLGDVKYNRRFLCPSASLEE